MQKPDSECANNHITHVSEVQMGFLSWIGNILEREKPVDAATDWLLHGLRLAAVSVLLAAHTARVGLWNRLAPVCHLRWGRCENHKTTSGSSGLVRSACSLPYSSMRKQTSRWIVCTPVSAPGELPVIFGPRSLRPYHSARTKKIVPAWCRHYALDFVPYETKKVCCMIDNVSHVHTSCTTMDF